MGKDSKIQWTQDTINFWTGCERVSRGCAFCYMYRDQERWGKDPSKVIRTADATFYKALTWKKSRLIFTCSLSDFFIEEADAWRDEAWDVIRKTPQHTWQILTKRPERIKECLPKDWGGGWDNVWLGITTEDQQTYYERMSSFMKVPAKVKFLSCEPLLEALHLADCRNPHSGKEHNWEDIIDWVIVGGESGFGKKPLDPSVKYKYRVCEVEWMENIVHRCSHNGVPVFVKQLGKHLAKKLGTKDPKGGDIAEFPPQLQVREFPEQYNDRRVFADSPKLQKLMKEVQSQ